MRQATDRRAAREGGRSESRINLYDEVTQRIIAQLEAGTFPWAQPWSVPGQLGAASLGLPYNALTGRAYSGINILMLWGALHESGYPGQGWLTFRQALSAGGHVRKGERGVTIVYADRFTPEDEKTRVWEEAARQRPSRSSSASPSSTSPNAKTSTSKSCRRANRFPGARSSPWAKR